MTKTGYKKIFIVLLLLAFTSQSFATLVMPCQFVSQTSDSTKMAGMDHSAMMDMDHSTMADSGNTGPMTMDDCCKTVGHCNSGSCSHVFFSHSFTFSLLPTPADMKSSFISLAPESPASSLFRPPIFC
jgi:hypothetical protein